MIARIKLLNQRRNGHVFLPAADVKRRASDRGIQNDLRREARDRHEQRG
jgi:hypothetical protein